MSSEEAHTMADAPGEVVKGTVQLMGDEPDEPGLRHRLAGALERRPWIIPAALMTAVGLLVVARRH